MVERAHGGADPSDAFGLVANETRVAILEALWTLTSDTGETTASFATLREEAGVRDSGQFNYHLDELRPQFVRKTDDGYRLTIAGRRIVGAAVSGVYTDLETSMDPRPVGECPECDGTLTVEYGDGQMAVECRDCGTRAADMHAPPVLVAMADEADLPDRLGAHLLTEIQRMNRGFCLYCGGPLTASVERRADGSLREDWNVSYTCRACGQVSYSLVSGAVIDHPAVVSLLYEAGIDVRETPIWELDAIIEATERVVGDDPLRVRTVIETDDAALALTLDDDLTVRDVERRDP